MKVLNFINGKANCAACHVSETTSDKNGNLIPPMFTDFTYDNIDLPRNVNDNALQASMKRVH